jgi:hypothetical protein
MHDALRHGQGAAAHIKHHQQLAPRVHRRPHPVRCTFQTHDGRILANLAGFERSQHCIQLAELQLLQVEITEKIRGKGPELLGRFDQPVQHRVGVDFENSRRGADPQALSEAGQNAHDAFNLSVFAVEDGAMRFQKIPLARRTVELTPGAAAGMAIGAQIAQTEPASVVTTGMRTKMQRGIDLTGPRRVVAIGSGGTGGGAWGWAASRSHRAQWGLCVRPANGLGS